MEFTDRISRVQQQWNVQRPDLDVAPQGIIGRLHRLANYLTSELVSVYEKHGLSEGEFDVLATLRRSGEPFAMAPSELAAHTVVTTGAMTKRLDRLVASGLVSREPVEVDQRRRRVSLTETGLQTIDAAFTEHMANEKRLIAHLSQSDQELLQKLLHNWLTQYENPGRE
ncbi:MarR family winged helix-turn-helix transcriptional regulator [Glutamicibacter sp. NPDC087344]|uniref:MarR family winged helix-turn-helix transcriptional regulator n=1 Tax=Glutamicibacter sp. NPDC087344 TaxID=3363994 RepID=UPI00380F882F